MSIVEDPPHAGLAMLNRARREAGGQRSYCTALYGRRRAGGDVR